ncbi:glucosyltransferase domain-containing protein [Acidisphaera rubrifaciens]|uniref:Glucosyl transferase GtrII n=1 Tax=Acidisphaera rubrifaciens HS-AP3 TaxID=1231350 RepID=A0A0D6P811_9PROT|nr:glucosyltransferase domain-containing protein [Acidisphaera rubrifaciens]GAN77910.1 hypothetical protein Asru_0508_09 [Acidisphaera rubrifaciens HS-AP3]
MTRDLPTRDTPAATFACAFAAAVLVYFHALSHFPLHIDTETQVVIGSIGQTIALGRWGIALLHATVLPEPAVAYFTPLLSLALLAAAAVAAETPFAFPPEQRWLFVAVFAGFPQFAYQLEFANQSVSLALGLFCTTAGGALWLRGGASRRVAAVALCAFGVGFYQSLLFVMPTLWAAAALHAVRSRGASTADVARSGMGAFALTLAAAVISVAIARAVQWWCGVPNAGGYLSQMVGWHRDGLAATLWAESSDLGAYVAGGRFYGNSLYALAPAAAVVVALSPCGPPVTLARRVAGVALGIVTVALPFALIVLLGAPPPPRTYLAEPVAVAALVTMALGLLPGGTAARGRMAAGVGAVVLLVACFHVSRLFYADSAALSADLLLGNRVVETIYRTDPGFDAARVPVWFAGAPAIHNVWRGADYDVFGASFFTWDGGNPMRIGAFLKVAGIADLRLASPADIARIRPAVASLPVWPDPRAVCLIDGVLVVRLGR